MLIEDDPVTQSIVKNGLESEYEIRCFSKLEDANGDLATLLETNTKSTLPDLIILDRGLPDGDGVAFCTKLRTDLRLKDIPIIFLSGKDTESDKVIGFYAGGDDYMVKPFGLLELKARIGARLKNIKKNLDLAQISVDLETHRVYRVDFEAKQKNELELTRIEYRILVAFLQHPDRVMSRNNIMDKVWGADCAMSDRVVDTHISHLRKKIISSGLNIEAMRGEGYRLTVNTYAASSVA